MTDTAATARQTALDALVDRQGMVLAHLDRLLTERDLSGPDAALAAELVCGVTRRRRTLDAIIRAHSDRPKRKGNPLIQTILRMGVYQIVMLDRVPDFAAVNEAVEICRRYHPRRAGFVNAVLRGVARSVGEAQTGTPPVDDCTVPIAADRYRVMDGPVFRPPAEEPAWYFAEAVSLPDDLAERWLQTADSTAAAVRMAMQINARPPVVARVNLSQTTVAEVLEELAAAGVEATGHTNGMSIVLGGHADVAALGPFVDGRISPQDATASEAVEALDVQPGMRVLDFCAAPGSKTVQIGEHLRGQGEIVAVDVDQRKLQRIAEGVERCGMTDLVRLCPASEAGSLAIASFDRVLVDAPCSNTGVLARRVEARWRFDAGKLGKMAADQRQLLALAAMFCSSNGRLVYSTCSIETEENDRVVQAFAKRHGRAKVIDRKFIRPQGFVPPAEYRDGGFWAAMKIS